MSYAERFYFFVLLFKIYECNVCVYVVRINIQILKTIDCVQQRATVEFKHRSWYKWKTFKTLVFRRFDFKHLMYKKMCLKNIYSAELRHSVHSITNRIIFIVAWRFFVLASSLPGRIDFGMP